MAQDATKILVGAPSSVTIGAWVSAAGTATLSDPGHLLEPLEIASEVENFDVEVETAKGIVKTVPVKTAFTVKLSLAQAEIENMRIAWRQSTGNVTGTSPNFTFVVNDAIEAYHRIVVVGPGEGTNSTRTATLWKCQVQDVQPVTFGKKTVQGVNITFRVLQDTTVATTQGQYYKIVES